MEALESTSSGSVGTMWARKCEDSAEIPSVLVVVGQGTNESSPSSLGMIMELLGKDMMEEAPSLPSAMADCDIDDLSMGDGRVEDDNEPDDGNAIVSDPFSYWYLYRWLYFCWSLFPWHNTTSTSCSFDTNP